MAQRLIRDFVGDLMRVLELPDPVVEFGALQVEADQDGDLRPLFAGRSYVGTDMREGPGVDRVEDLRALTFGDGAVGTASGSATRARARRRRPRSQRGSDPPGRQKRGSDPVEGG